MDRRVNLNRTLRLKAIGRALAARRLRRMADASGSPARSRVAWSRFRYVLSCLRAMRAKVAATSAPTGKGGKVLSGAARAASARKAERAFREARKAERTRYYRGDRDGSLPQGY